MADNIQVSAGTGTTVATEELAGVHYQQVKINYGGSNEVNPITNMSPLPVTLGDQAEVKTQPFYISDSGGPDLSSVLGLSNTGLMLRSGDTGAFGFVLSNGDSAARWVKIYDKATVATASDTPVARVLVPAGGSVTWASEAPMLFQNGISVRATSEATDGGTTGAAANTVAASVISVG